MSETALTAADLMIICDALYGSLGIADGRALLFRHGPDSRRQVLDKISRCLGEFNVVLYTEIDYGPHDGPSVDRNIKLSTTGDVGIK